MQDRKPLPVGTEFYKKMIENGYYYVDKTLLIRDILRRNSDVILFTRPRRFGKTLTQTMLRTFFEKEILPDGTVSDNSLWFAGKKIMDAGEEYTRHMGQYPVIFLSLKSAKQPTYEMARRSLVDEIVKEYDRHDYVLASDRLREKSKEKFISISQGQADDIAYAKSIAFLSECLEQYYGQKVVILVDEYDVPLENAYFEGFYDEMVRFIRSLFESALKTNSSLKFAVITGCLRISRESIFTGLNNLDVVSVLDESYAEYFGFTQQEVDDMLVAYGMAERRDEVKDWYDGYLFGKTEIYNPWSVINYIKDVVCGNTEFPKPYWSNTSSNSIVRELIEHADQGTRDELEKLIAGEMIEKPVREDITYGDIYWSKDNFWNFLFFTGYLRAVDRKFVADTIYLSMRLPNREIRYIYRNTVLEWFERCIQKRDMSGLIRALEKGECDVASEFITEQLLDTISFYDYAESYYQGFLAGLLKQGDEYLVRSNRESGLGRYDLVLKTRRVRKGRAIILELQVAKSIRALEEGCRQALEQIEVMHYDSELLGDGYVDIKKYGVCFYKKECMVCSSPIAGDIS